MVGGATTIPLNMLLCRVSAAAVCATAGGGPGGGGGGASDSIRRNRGSASVKNNGNISRMQRPRLCTVNDATVVQLRRERSAHAVSKTLSANIVPSSHLPC